MRTLRKGPGVGRHSALGVKEPGSPTRRNPSLSWATVDAVVTAAVCL